MHLGLNQLGSFFAQHQGRQALVLATVVETSGSTYRKPGALMLIAADGSFAGLISGGCLEDDLIKHAAAVFSSGAPQLVDYDLNDDPELVWGLGLGCGGSVHVLLQLIRPGAPLQALGALFQGLGQGQDGALAVVFDSAAAELPIGTLAVISGAGQVLGPPQLVEALRHEAFTGRRCAPWSLDQDDTPVRAVLIQASAPPQVLICGAGPDAAPLAAQVRALGWSCSVVDHRPAYARAERFAAGVQVHCLRPGQLGELELQRFSAAVVMSHHVGHDRAYLQQLGQCPPAYIGLLGPSARRQTLLDELGSQAPVVHGPAGLDIGAELPESIALSIVAEIHACLNGRSGRSLSRG